MPTRNNTLASDWVRGLLTALTFGLLFAGTNPPELAQGLGPPAEIKIGFNQRVPMRDGVELSADVYRPATGGASPVILTRTPYNKSSNVYLNWGRFFASHGYVFVAMDVRGRGDSDGQWTPWRNEGLDGYDSIEWCARQQWSNGKVGTLGPSYLGYDQWLAAVQQPLHLVTMIALVAMTDPFGDPWISGPGGLPSPTTISWFHFTSGHTNQNMDAVDWAKLYWHLPIRTLDEAAGRPNSSWKEVIDHPKLDAWWEPMRYQNHYDRVRATVLHISGWYDDTQRATPMNFRGMRAEGATEAIRKGQKLLIGPWPHAVNSTSKLGEIDFGPAAKIDLEGYELRWFDYWLKGNDNGILREPPVRLFVMGENRWADEDDWPLARTRWTKYYLRSGGRANSLFGDGSLSSEAPGEESPDHYTDDPAQPVPFITEPSFAQIGGPDDYRPVERRDDVLVYTSPAMDEATEICGPLRVSLFAASSARDTDFMSKVLDVWPNGFAERLNDGMVRARFRNGMARPELIEPGRVYAYDIDCWNTCQTFLKGHRVRLEIASSAFPKYDRNPNTGEALGQTTRLEIAEETVYHDTNHASYLLLPIIPRKP